MKDLTAVTNLLFHLPPYTYTHTNMHTEFSSCVLQSAHAFPSHPCPTTSPAQLLSLCLIPVHSSSQLPFQGGRGPGHSPWNYASFPRQPWGGEAPLFIWLVNLCSTRCLDPRGCELLLPPLWGAILMAPYHWLVEMILWGSFQVHC